MADIITTVTLSASDYLKVIGSSPVPIAAIDLKPGRYYKLVNRETRTYMLRYLRVIVGEYTYWE